MRLWTAPIFTLQLLIDGILIGSIFALAAYGMAMVWGVMKIINFAQGEFVILGGFILYSLTRIGLNPFLAIPLVPVVIRIRVFPWVSRSRPAPAWSPSQRPRA